MDGGAVDPDGGVRIFIRVSRRPTMKRFLFLAFFPFAVAAAPPADVAIALEYLRDQRSYSWEVINADPGPVKQDIQTPRGSVLTVRRNNAPNIKGAIDRAGDILLRRDWPDGLQLDTWITADGHTLTRTPEGWMTAQEILTAQAEERLREDGPGPRLLWLRRADRPEFARPNEELAPLLKTKAPFEEVGRDTYVVRGSAHPGENDFDEDRGYDVTITLHLRGGVIRDYEIEVDGTHAIRRAGVQLPVSEHRIVVVKYLPVSRVDVPPEARAKLELARTSEP